MMSARPTEEQRLLGESAQRWVADSRAVAAGAAHWREMAGFGWLGMTLPEADGGLGQGLAEACLLAEAFGAGPVNEPYIPVILQAAELIARCGDSAQRQRWLPAIVAGEALVAPARFEPRSGFAPRTLRTRAARSGSRWRLDGVKRPVVAGDAADAWLVSAAGDDGGTLWFIVPRDTPGVTVRPFDTVDGGRACTLLFEGVELGDDARLAVTDEEMARADDHACVAACAEAVGAMAAVLAATLEYTRTRVQFGKPLAALQVLRHRMADMSIACEEARAITQGAIGQVLEAGACGDTVARALAASAARVKVAKAALHVAEEAIQLHGGMGVTEELDIGRFLRRQLALDALIGGADWHLRRYAGLRGTNDPARARGGSAGANAFRGQVRAFLREHLTDDLVRAARLNSSVFSEPDVGMRWHRALHARGWIAPAWPVEYGGTGWSLEERWIFETECAEAGAPALSPLGLRMAGPVIMKFGTPAQKAHYLPRLLAGDDYWCQGYSEPGAGSDLASLATRGRRERGADGAEVYVIEGTKIWTTHAHFANRMFALVRTGEGEARKQDGITFLLIDMRTPGITVRPIRGVSGDHEVNQVFFDGARVPVSCRLGEEGRGWTVAKYLLEFERGGAITAGRLRAALGQVQRAAGAGAAGDPDLALAIAAVEIDVRALEATELSIMSALTLGQNPGSVSSLLKLRWSEIHQAITRLGVRVLGPDALAWESSRPLHLHDNAAVLDDAGRPLVAAYLNARAFTIFGGTSEIQREIIARELVG